MTQLGLAEEDLADLTLPVPYTLTLGEDGAYCMRGDEILYQPAFPVQPVDTTAAGDTFTGYFVTGLSHDEDLSKVMERAAKAAAIAVSRAGAAESIPYANEV